MMITIRLSSIVGALFFYSCLYAQTIPSISWETSIGGEKNESIADLINISNRELLAVGYQEKPTSGDKDFLVVKIGEDGTSEWQFNYGGSNDEEAIAAILTPDNGFMVLGWSESTDGDIGNPLGDRFFWLIKLDDLGNLEWENSYGSGNSDDTATDLLAANDGNFLLLGYTTTSSNGKDVWLLKIAPDGSLLWDRTYGDIHDEKAYDVEQTLDNGLVLCGEQVHPDSAASLFYFIATDADGMLNWEKTYGGSLPDIAVDIEVKADGSFSALGHSCSPNGDLGVNYGFFDIWLLHLSVEGELESKNQYGGSKNDYAKDLHLTVDGAYLITTASQSNDFDVEDAKGNFDYWLLKLNQSGSEAEWKMNLGGSEDDMPSELTALGNSEFVVAGNTLSTDGDIGQNAGEKDGWIAAVKLNCIYKPLPILGSQLQDSMALVQLFDAAKGDFWFDNSNWLTANPIKEWFGVETESLCATNEERVTKIQLPNNNLHDSLTYALQDLFCADSLIFNNNRISSLPALFTAPEWQILQTPIIDVNHNKLEFGYIADNSCLFSDTSQYHKQRMDLVREYREEFFPFPLYIPETETIDIMAGYFVDYSWSFTGIIDTASTTNRIFYPSPFAADDDNGLYIRTAIFTGNTTCQLEQVEITYPFELLVHETFPEYLHNHFIVHYEDSTDLNTIIQNNMELENDSVGATLVKECPCGPTIQLWSVSESVNLETVRMSAQQKAKIDTTEYDYLFPYTKEIIFDGNSVGGGFNAVDMVEDETYLDLLPTEANNVKIGIVDSGVDENNPYVEPYIWYNPELHDTNNCVLHDVIGYDFSNLDGVPNDAVDHGTPINAIIARDYPTGEIQLINGKFYDNGFGDLFDAVCAMHYVMDEGVDILNLSWGVYSDTPSFILREAIQRAYDEDIMVVTSAGNSAANSTLKIGADIDSLGKWPANFMREFDNIIVVGAYHEPLDSMLDTLIFAQYSNFGDSTVHLAAPGRISVPGFVQLNGTSIATPYVTRAAASAMGSCPDMPISTIKTCMLSTVTAIPGFEDKVIYKGIFNLEGFQQCIDTCMMMLHPIELKGKWIPSYGIELNWTTHRDYSDALFTVMKRSNSTVWQQISQKQPAQYLSSKLGFTEIDVFPTSGSNFYRVEVTLLNGEVVSSPVIEVKIPVVEKGNISIFPNPSSQSKITVNTNFRSDNKVLEIKNLNGQVMYSKNSSQDIIQVDLLGIEPGMYIIHVYTENESIAGKLIVQ